MRAVVTHDFGASSVETVSDPRPDRGEVVVEIDRVQLSVTECQLYRGREVAHYDEVAARIAAGDPQLFGHEFCGRVVALADDVTGLSEGDRVYAPGKLRCGECAYCTSGSPDLCANRQGIGYDRPGALAERVALPAEPLCRLPDSVSDAAGAAMQPLASALLCTVDAGIDPGDVVAVVGTGVMGYLIGQIAPRFGAAEVFAIDVRDRPLEHATERGMRSLNATELDPAERVAAATDGVGADVVFEAAGGKQAHATEGTDPLATAHRLARRDGTVVQVGHVEGDVAWTPRDSRSKMLDWVNPRKGDVRLGPNGTSGELAPKWIADGTVSVEEFVTHELDGLESFERAVEVTLEKADHGALGPAQIVVGE